MIPFGLSSLMALSLPIGRRATKCLTAGATAIYLLDEGAGQVLNDFSGHAYDGILGRYASAPANDPTWAATGLEFDGADDYCRLPDLPDLAAFQVVFRNDTAITPATVAQCLFGFASAGTTYPGISFGAATGLLVNEVVTIRPGGAKAAAWSDAAGVIPAGWHVLTVSWDGTAWSISLDGAHLPMAAANAPTIAAAPTSVHLGSDSAGTNLFTGGIGPVLVYPSGLTADQVDANERALAGIMAARGETVPLTQQPIVLFEFDDGLSSIYDNAYPALTAAGAKGTVYVVTDRIDSEVDDSMTTAEIAALYAAGWDIGGHGYTHDFNLSGATEAAQTAEIGDCRDDLLARGFTRSANHYCYRGGSYDATTLSVMATLGLKTGRTIGLGTMNRFNRVFFETAGCRSLDQNRSLADAKALVDALVPGQILQFYGHLIDDSAEELSWTAADLQALATYVRSKGITPLTISELYTLLGGT